MKYILPFLFIFTLTACNSDSGSNAPTNFNQPQQDVSTSSTKCGTDNAQGTDYTWCITTPKKLTNDDVIFYFHGLGGDENAWINQYKSIQSDLEKKGKAPTVIAISFGPVWFITDEDTQIHPALHSAIIDSIIPKMESRLPNPVKNRMVMGDSMGGFNAAEVFIKDTALFSRALFICPAMSTLSPYSTDEDLQKYLSTRNYIDQNRFYKSRQLSLVEFPTVEIWNSVNPLNIIRGMTTKSPIFISAGTRDEWGFYDGSQDFANLAKKQNLNVTWISILGKGHCVQTPASAEAMVNFIAAGVSH